MRTIRLALALSFITAAATPIFGQWTTVSAQKTTSKKITSPSGAVLQNTSTTGNYYRSRSGSVATITVQSSPDGELQLKTGKLLDNSGLILYTIDYNNKIAYRDAELDQPRQVESAASIESHAIRTTTLDGLKCVVLPITENGKQVGSVWKSPKYDLVLKMDFSMDISGEVTHVSTELSNIHLNAKVPAQVFQVPVGFAVMKSPDKLPAHQGSMSMLP